MPPARRRSLTGLRQISQIACLIVFTLAGFIFLGWLIDSAAIRNHFPGISPATSFAFVLTAGASWLLMSGKGRTLARLCAALAVLIGVLKLSEVLFGIDTGIDHLILIASLAAQPKLFAPNSALNFALIGLGLFCFDAPSERRLKWGQLFTLIALLLAFLALIGYTYSVDDLYDFRPSASISLTAAVLFFVLCLALLSAQISRGLTAVIVSDSSGGLMGRRLLPLVIVVPVALGGLRLIGENAGFYETERGVALFAVSTVVILLGIIWWNAQGMDRTDQDRRRLQQALGESEARYHALFEHSNDALLVIDAQGHYIDANPQASRLTGYSRDELLHLKFGDLSPVARAETARHTVAEIEQKGVVTGESVIRQKDGSEVIVEFSSVTIALGLYQATIRDISRRKKAEQALHESEARYRALFEHSSDMILIIDEDGRYIDANPQAERLTGYSRSELLTMHSRDLNSSTLTQDARNTLDVLKQQGIMTSESRIIRKDGTEVPVEFTARAIGAGLYQSIVHDISERKQVEDNLRRALEQERDLNERKSRFVSMVSHDFRTPLAIIQSSTELLMSLQ